MTWAMAWDSTRNIGTACSFSMWALLRLTIPLSHTHTPLFYPSLSSHTPPLEQRLAQPPTLSSQVEPCASLADHSATWRAGEREGWEWCVCARVQCVVYFILSSHTASVCYIPSSLYTLPRTSTMHNWVFCFPPLLSSLPSRESAVPPPWQTTPCLPSSALHCSRSDAHRTHTLPRSSQSAAAPGHCAPAPPAHSADVAGVGGRGQVCIVTSQVTCDGLKKWLVGISQSIRLIPRLSFSGCCPLCGIWIFLLTNERAAIFRIWHVMCKITVLSWVNFIIGCWWVDRLPKRIV